MSRNAWFLSALSIAIGLATSTASAQRLEVELPFAPAEIDGAASIDTRAWFTLAEPGAADGALDQGPRTLFGLPLNVGPVDRLLRVLVAGALVGVATWGLSTQEVDDWVSGVLYGVSAIPALTGAIGYCGLYEAAGVRHSF